MISLAHAGPPATQPHYLLAATASLLDAHDSRSLLQQAKDLGFDSIEAGIGDLPRDRPNGQSATSNPSALDGLAFALHLHTRQYAALNAGAAASISEDDPIKVPASLYLTLTEQLRCPLVLPVENAALDADRERGISDLKQLAARAAAANTIVALDTPFGPQESVTLLDAVNSSNIRCVFDPLKISAAHSDPYQAFRLIGHARIAQVRLTSPANETLEDGLIQLPVLKEALDETGWSGWIVLQPQAGKSLAPERVKQDAAFLGSVFGAKR